jgi:signal transduction histidine kinase
LNLILNAIDATGAGGRIVVRAEAVGERLIIHVEDDGAGIAPEHQARLFQPYFTTKKHGTGLGLFVSQKLVVDHGGAIDCASTPGQGTSFRVTLPKAAMVEPVVVTRDAASAKPQAAEGSVWQPQAPTS